MVGRGRDGVVWPILGDCGSLDPGSNVRGADPRGRRLSVPALSLPRAGTLDRALLELVEDSR
jgi:hypothetical protein